MNKIKIHDNKFFIAEWKKKGKKGLKINEFWVEFENFL